MSQAKRFTVGQVVSYDRGFEANYQESDIRARLLKDVTEELGEGIEAYDIEVIRDGRKFSNVDIDCLSAI